MKFAVLAPRPQDPNASMAEQEQDQVPAPSKSDWLRMRPKIEQLYVGERRSLRTIMRSMEKLGFKATEQMYKKRFFKWGFQKNIRRKKPRDDCWSKPEGCDSETTLDGELCSSSHHDTTVLLILTTVRTWSVAFFESMRLDGRKVPAYLPECANRVKDVSFDFKLVIDLLDRRRGHMAGRMARHAFLFIENLLVLDAPALIWNLLEMMHTLVTLRQTQLFHMLLAHLIALVDGRMPASHPLPGFLRAIRQIAESSVGGARDGRANSAMPLQFLLQRAWVLNAELVFGNFEPRLLPLYFSLLWDSSSIGPPENIVSFIDYCGSKIEAFLADISTAAMVAAVADEAFGVDGGDDGSAVLGRLLGPRTDASPPRDFAMLRTSSIAALRKHGDLYLADGAGFPNGADTSNILSMIAALVKAKVIDGWSAAMDALPNNAAATSSTKTTPVVSRLQAGHLASVIRSLVNLDLSGGFRSKTDIVSEPSSGDVVDMMQAVVALREYSQGETDPQLVRDLWLLQDTLVAAGEKDEARLVGQDAYRRLEKYLEAIPTDHVQFT
ncbi:hypothetical protein B0T26DRAFT_691513 [Lasiosphaeria miniovina]|uniref:Clr5 domain-containing protein n=1 Tax=Lasiosphaeria miniovina TaxID=1954250 RepID=A0AA40E3I6_9PEZI|nr:uncharacterized protein B0T26DRAFT_691513 [Lasiosphaeria miniovina]KAK0726724.1 hypothetical protein B0T26DRAFT_691513 [Lasiosphaeria miniovina]